MNTNCKKAAFITSYLLLYIMNICLPNSALAQKENDIRNDSNTYIQNDVFWKDNAGRPLYSQGGDIIKIGNKYYWYGVAYTGAVKYFKTGERGRSDFRAITCYSSYDLINWTFEGNVMTAAQLGKTGWIGRIGVVHNKKTKKHILISQYYGKYGNGIMFATSKSPTATFHYDHLQTSIKNVVNDLAGDQTIFTDDDGKSYLVFCNRHGRSHLYVAPLGSDDMSISPAVNVYNSRKGGREGNVMFKHNGIYYICSSDLHGWNASYTYCIQADHIYGPYSKEYILKGTKKDFSHVSQTGLMVKVKGAKKSFVIFGGDRWSDFAGNGIGYNEWAPITFNGTTPVFHSLSQWDPDLSTGTWSVGPKNNYILNPGFEADRILQKKLAGWINWTNLKNKDVPNGNVKGGHTGNFAMMQFDTIAYKARQFQKVNVPNGTYHLTVWVKSSGGQKTAQIFAKSLKGEKVTYKINYPINNWEKISIQNIPVKNGNLKIGIYSDAKAYQWIKADDFKLIGQQD